MQIKVLFFGILKDLAGRSSEVLTLPEEASAGDILRHYESQISLLKGGLGSIAISVNQQYSRPEVKLNSGDEVALLPPVSGGSSSSGGSGDGSKTRGLGRETRSSSRVAITRESIEPQALLSSLQQAEDGALVIFEGVVRNHSRGRRTLFLEYEAYEQMALKKMESLVSQVLANFTVRDARIVHRLGRLEIGETSVLIIVASAHRASAFEACRWLIDTLKRTVPIWKKEYFEDGAVWADGEPFPEELSAEALDTHSESAASKPVVPK
jgi:molybdopterin synthase catalytic subunit